MKKERNRYYEGFFLVEHDPSMGEPYQVWDLRMLFTVESGFGCRTLGEAQELCSQLRMAEDLIKKGKNENS